MTQAEKLCQKLETRIASGIYAPGQPLPSVRKLMDEENLGSATVQKSLSKLESKGLLDRHPNRGFFVIQSQKTTEHTLPHIGLIAGSANYLTNEFYRGATSVYEGSKYILSSFIAGNDPNKYDEFFDKVRQCKMSGIILSHMPCKILANHLEQFEHANVPIVLWGAEIPSLVCDRVCFNLEFIGSIIARRIIQKGYKKIRFLTTTDRHPQEVQDFFTGLQSELRAAGIIVTKKNIHYYETKRGYGKTFDSFIDSQEYVAGMLRNDDDFDLLICCHENTVVGAVRAIEAAGLRVPEDIAVISAERCAYLDPLINRQITSFELNPYALGKIAGDIMMKRIQGLRSMPQVHFMSGEIIDGDTD